MIDTNGLSVASLVTVPPDKLYYVRVSLDGASASTHETVRGAGTFERTLGGIRELVAAGHHVRITYTILNFNRHELGEILRLADDLGVRLVNFHSFSEEGYGDRRSAQESQTDSRCRHVERSAALVLILRAQDALPPWQSDSLTSVERSPARWGEQGRAL